MKPVGSVTRGTTNPNRLRRADRWFIHTMCGRLRAADQPVCVDVGYGRNPRTTLEWHERLAAHVRTDIQVVGIEIDADRVAEARIHEKPGVSFLRGGFEVPLPAALGHRRVHAIRAFNVLRQYGVDEVPSAWNLMASRLAPEGILIDGTCDEIGRICSWVALAADADGNAAPLSLTFAAHVSSLDKPSVWAQRLPKVLIHRNVDGERIHEFLAAADRAWASAAGMAVFSARQRFVAMAERLAGEGWPIADSAARWRLGELTIAWDAVAPAA